MSTERITDDLQRLLALLPTPVQDALAPAERRNQLLEVVLDLGRIPEARYPGRSVELGGHCLERQDLEARQLAAMDRDEPPPFSAGDTVNVACEITEGTTKRIQNYAGVVSLQEASWRQEPSNSQT